MTGNRGLVLRDSRRSGEGAVTVGRQRPEPLSLPDEAAVTHYGEAGPLGEGFRDELRAEIGETDISLIWGRSEMTGSGAVLPVLGNLAWAPMPSVDHVDILDRFNGVPTLGVVEGSGGSHLFWRLAGYVPKNVSCWLYVPLAAQDVEALEDDGESDLLDGLVFRSRTPRWVTVSVAWDYRVIFEREWQLPTGLSSDELVLAFLRFVAEALRLKVEQGLPTSRMEIFRAASDAVQEMVTA